MTPELTEIIGAKTQPKQLSDLCQRLKNLMLISRQEMAKYYDQWDYFDQVYRGERKIDIKDLKARARGEPEKMVIPLTYSQVETFAAFGYATYNQKPTFYEIIASGQEDETPAKIAEAVLEQNLNYNKFRATKLNQLLTDIAKYGIGVTKESWTRDTVPVVSQVPDQAKMQTVQPDAAQPAAVPMKTQVDYKTKYLGNKITSVSPYRFFPDVRLPLTRWSEGEYCGDEVEKSKGELEHMQGEGTIAGLENVAELPTESFQNRRLSFFTKDQATNPTSQVLERRYYLLTEIQMRLNPSKCEISEGVFLNPDVDCEQIYVIWILNDDRIVKIEEAGYDHEEFGYNVAQFFDDQNRFLNLSLCEVLSALQDTATWFLNSHITSVRKSIFNQMVVDESAIYVDDIVKRSPVIRMRGGRAGSGIDTWIKQLNVVDVTQNHVNDVASLSGYAKEASGINENLLGQFSPGRRSAREASNVSNYAAARLIKILASIWESCLAPMGRKMLSNIRQGMDEPMLVRVYGQVNTQRDQQAADQLIPNLQPQMGPTGPVPTYQTQSVTKDDLIGSYDFDVFNGTLQSQKQQTAQVLMEWLQTAMKDPRVIIMSQLDPQLVLYEVFELLGVRNVQRFQLTPQRLQQLMLMAQPPGNPGGTQPAQAGGNGTQRPNVQPNAQPRSGPTNGQHAPSGTVVR